MLPVTEVMDMLGGTSQRKLGRWASLPKQNLSNGWASLPKEHFELWVGVFA